MKTSELQGAAIDWAVAKCKTFDEYLENDLPLHYSDANGEFVLWKPSTDWAQGGPIIEREGISIGQTGDGWEATVDGCIYVFGPTPLIAAMRCYVASKLGDEVEIPNELMENELCY